LVQPFLRDVTIFTSFLILVSVGITLTYMTSKVPNFAQGTFVTLGVYVGLTTVRVWRLSPYFGSIFAFLLGGVASYMMYRFAIAPQIRKNAPTTALIMTTVAIDTLFIGIFNSYADYLQLHLGIISRLFLLNDSDFVLFGENGILYVAPVLVVVLVLTLHFLLTRTRFGIAMRAAVIRPALASVLGVNVDLVYAISWFTAGGLAGAAGALYPLWFISSPDVAFSSLLISGFAGSILGGLLNIYGAFLGACIMGVAELLGTVLLSGWLGTWIIGYRIAIPLTVMVVTLLILPEGITNANWRGLIRRLRVRS